MFRQLKAFTVSALISTIQYTTTPLHARCTILLFFNLPLMTEGMFYFSNCSLETRVEVTSSLSLQQRAVTACSLTIVMASRIMLSIHAHSPPPQLRQLHQNSSKPKGIGSQHEQLTQTFSVPTYKQSLLCLVFFFMHVVQSERRSYRPHRGTGILLQIATTIQSQRTKAVK